jgi:hypothetical protein
MGFGKARERSFLQVYDAAGPFSGGKPSPEP